MKITSKLMMLNVEHQITVGNDAITATVIHQICLSEGKNGEVDADIDFVDIEDIKFLGIDIESGYTGFKKFKSQMSEMGIDVDALIDEECVGLITTGDIQELKNEYRNLVK
jgi:hypothetical protein